MPEISIIMGVYNGERTVGLALDSLLSQTFKDFEIIVCDDGSSDNTLKVLKEYSKRDSRIIVLQNDKNSGLAYTLNHCLSVSKGIYIARQDADDISHKERLEKSLSAIKKYNCDYIGCKARLFDENGIWGVRGFDEVVDKYLIARKNPFIHPTMLIRRDVLLNVDGYRVAEETMRTEDYDLIMRLTSFGYVGRNIQEVLYDFYESRDSYKKHTLTTRIYEMKVRLFGYRMMDMPAYYYIYAFKPIALYFLPMNIYAYMKKRQWTKSK